MNTLFERNLDTYLDVGHDIHAVRSGRIDLWAAWEGEGDVHVTNIGNASQGHGVMFPPGYDYFGRIDHDNRIISFTRSGGGFKENYFKDILEMDYPGYEIVDL